MSPKRPIHPPKPLSSEEEEEEEEETSSQSDDESSSSEDGAKNVTSSQAPIPNSEDSDSDSESDDVITSKPIASIPIQETPSSKKPRSHVSKRVAENDVALQPKKSKGNHSQVSKRVAENDVISQPKEGKGNDSVLNLNRKQLFQRLFSEDDEVVLLKGIIEFIEKKGIDPMKNFSGFYEFVKSSISVNEFSVSQLKDKVIRLKKRFENNVSKSQFGENKKFSNPQAQQVFDLMRRIWGSEGVCFSGAESSLPSNGKAGGVKANKGGSSSSSNSNEGKKVGKEKVGEFRVLDMEDYAMRMGLLEEEEKVVMERKWKELHEAELELFLRRSKLVTQHAKLVLAIKNKKNCQAGFSCCKE